MLCVQLNPNEKLFAGNEIVFVNRTPGRINIGIEAPLHVKILRESVRIRDERRQRKEPSDGKP